MSILRLVFLALLLAALPAFAQEEAPLPPAVGSASSALTNPAPDAESQSTLPGPQQGAGTAASQPNADESEQTKRIFWVIPNYRAVSANARLPALTVKEKFWLATQDSFDYSAFIFAGLFAGYSDATRATPEFDDGAGAFGRYYWHSFADEAVGNYFTEAIMPSLTHEDPRYYTSGRTHGGFFHRTGYALSRLAVTRTDSGGTTFNFSEIVGNGLGAGLSDLYYPRQERTLGKTGTKWATQIGIDGIANVLKEFWPDIRQALRQK